MRRRAVGLVGYSRAEFIYDGEEIKCYRNKLAPRETSWSEANPGRRFYGCQNFKIGGCGFFRWYDSGMYDRAKQLLREFCDNERKLAIENENLRKLVGFSNGCSVSCDSGYSMKEEIHEVEIGSVGSNSRLEGEKDEFMKLKIELNLLKEKNKLLKLNATSLKRKLEIYKLLLFGFFCCLICIMVGMYFASGGKDVASLPFAY